MKGGGFGSFRIQDLRKISKFLVHRGQVVSEVAVWCPVAGDMRTRNADSRFDQSLTPAFIRSACDRRKQL